MQIFGIEAQTLLDSMLVVIDGHESAKEVTHCKGILWYAQTSTDLGLTCKPTDPAKVEGWKCQFDSTDQAYVSADFHHGCGVLNGYTADSYYCTCGDTPMASRVQDVTSTYNYFPRNGNSLCPGCANSHGNKVPCGFCGEVHD